jgi:hypothetical protein
LHRGVPAAQAIESDASQPPPKNYSTASNYLCIAKNSNETFMETFSSSGDLLQARPAQGRALLGWVG